MAAGTVITPNITKPKYMNGTILLASHSFKAAIINTTVNASSTGSSGQLRWADLSPNEVTSPNYTAGGAATTVGISGTSGTVTATCTGATWNNVTFANATTLVIYSDTATNKDVAVVAPFDANSAPQSGTYTSFAVTFSSGLFTY